MLRGLQVAIYNLKNFLFLADINTLGHAASTQLIKCMASRSILRATGPHFQTIFGRRK